MPEIINAAGSTIPNQRDLFEIPTDVVYLNCASQSPQLRSVTAAGLDSVKSKTEPWKISASDWFSGADALRESAAKVIGAETQSIALVPSVSYGIAVAAANVPVERGQSIVLLHDEFPSNYYAWKNLAVEREASLLIVQRRDGATLTEALLEAIDDKTAVVSVPNCHWTDGSLVDLENVSEKVRFVGASLVIDASQSLGAYPLDIAKAQPDFLVTVGYKWLLGPYALGYLYVAPRWQKVGRPIENSWLNRQGCKDFSSLSAYTDDYELGARRFDMGEFPNFVLVPMAVEGLRRILEWRVEKISRTLSVLTDLIAEEAIKLGCMVTPPHERVRHFIGIRLPNGMPSKLNERLAKEKIFVSIRGNAIRIAPHLYNDPNDIERLFAAIRKLI